MVPSQVLRGGIMRIRFAAAALLLSFVATNSLALNRREYIDQTNEKVNTQNPEQLDDSELVQAMSDRKTLDYAQGGNLVVTKILNDDKSGPAHQKWYVRLSNGVNMQAVYNLDMCERVPLKVGDRIAMGGQFICFGKGGLLHWLHRDPRGNRPDGYVYLNGKYYCK